MTGESAGEAPSCAGDGVAWRKRVVHSVGRGDLDRHATGRGGGVLAVALATVFFAFSPAGPSGLVAQGGGDVAARLDRVLAFPAAVGEERLDPDRGAMGAWQRIRKLGTTASLLHVTAHPDDENSGMLTLASREWGARTALLSLNRGEAGANAIGPELFDGLGLIRTRELVLAGRYYGLDDLYFTTAVDYGYSKSVEEAYRSWDREAVLEDMVRVIRLNRPLVVVARFHGSRRDGHGHHHASGLLTPEAVEAATDPDRFPRQIEEEGLRPWRALRTYRGGIRVDEPFHVEIDARGESPWLGTTYQGWASRGLGLQRSQTSGRVRTGGGLYRYELRGGGGDGGESVDAGGRADEDVGGRVDEDVGGRVDEGVGGRVDEDVGGRVDEDVGGRVDENVGGRADETLPPSQAEASFFAGLDTSLNGLPALLGEAASPETGALLARLQRLVDEVVAGFDFRAPGHSVPDLVRGLDLVRAAIASSAAAPETRFHLRLKERQFQEAIAAAGGVRVEAAVVGGGGTAVVVPGQNISAQIVIEAPGSAGLAVAEGRLVDRAGRVLGRASSFSRVGDGFSGEVEVRVPDADDDARAAAPYFTREGLAQNHYEVTDAADLHLPWRRPALSVAVDLVAAGTAVAYTVPLTAPVPRLPYGTVTRPVEVLPALSVVVDPAVRVVPVEGAGAPIPIQVRVTANTAPLPTTTRLEVPAGWAAAPANVAHDFTRAGEVAEVAFAVTPPDGWEGAATVEAVSRAGGREYRTGYQTIDHRDLRLARLWRPATTTVRSVAVARLDGARIGYVMGVGDEVPAAIEALGARVDLLDEATLADPRSIAGLDAIVVGTRAYAVRPDLLEHNQRLIEYARAGGHLVILYQTQEFVPADMAPYPASLPRGAEEVSEEDAPVRLLQPTHPFITAPNRITEADFDGWIEQRGSKFFTDWDAAYTPLVETHDQGQDPQEGIWLTAQVGEGHYTYLALALHRQLPYGVPGAFRILSNVLSAGSRP